MAGAAILRDPGVRLIALGWTAFLTENVVLSHNRALFVEQLGEDAYRCVVLCSAAAAARHVVCAAASTLTPFARSHRRSAMFSCFSTGAMAAIMVGYYRSRSVGPLITAARGWVAEGKVVGPPPSVRNAFALLFQGLGCVTASQLAPPLQMPLALGGAPTAAPAANSSSSAESPPPATAGPFRLRCPIDFRWNERVNKDGSVALGVDRVTRHPQIWSLALVGLGSALVTPYAASAAFFTGPLAFATVGFAHQDYRHRRGMGGMLSPERDAATSNVPFRALLEGRQSWSAARSELKGTNAVLALVPPLLLFLRRMR
jgi:hypothetical protein